MLNAWISINDIYILLEKCESIENLLEKKKLINDINGLKEYKKPKKKNKIRCINTYAKENIIKYKNSVKYKAIKGYLEIYFNNLNESQKKSFLFNFDVHLVDYDIFEWEYDNLEFDIKKFIDIIPAKNLKDIVGFSSRTVSRWNKNGIIHKHTMRISEKNEKGNIIKALNFNYYNLSEIVKK